MSTPPVAAQAVRSTGSGFALLGLPTDHHSSFMRGAAGGPRAIRAALLSDAGNLTAENGLEIRGPHGFVDHGDLSLTGADDDRAVITDAAARLAAARLPFVALGGDHAVTYPVVRGVAAAYRNLNILHFDAHPDLYDEFEGDRFSHACPFARIMEERCAARLVQVGIRAATPHQRHQAARFGVETVPMHQFRPDAVQVPGEPLYLSIDLDVFDPAFAPGVSHHEPGGLSVRDLIAVLHRITAPVVAADIVELNPDRDAHGVTAVVAAKLVKELAPLLTRGSAQRI